MQAGHSMQEEFVYMGPQHLTIIAAVPLVAGILSLAGGTGLRLRSGIRWFLAAALACNEFLYYGYLTLFDTPATPDGWPLQLCTVTVWLTVIALATKRQAFVDASWYLGAFGPTLGLLMPQLWAPTYSLPTIQFFIGHAGVLVSILYLACTGEARPTVRGAVLSFIALNAIGITLGGFNAMLGTNYMFLRNPPATPLLFSYLTPPLHLLAGEAAAIAAFFVLAMPFRSRNNRAWLSLSRDESSSSA